MCTVQSLQKEYERTWKNTSLTDDIVSHLLMPTIVISFILHSQLKRKKIEVHFERRCLYIIGLVVFDEHERCFHYRDGGALSGP